jgi:hypothetical protein
MYFITIAFSEGHGLLRLNAEDCTDDGGDAGVYLKVEMKTLKIFMRCRRCRFNMKNEKEIMKTHDGEEHGDGFRGYRR